MKYAVIATVLLGACVHQDPDQEQAPPAGVQEARANEQRNAEKEKERIARLPHRGHRNKVVGSPDAGNLSEPGAETANEGTTAGPAHFADECANTRKLS